VVITDLISQNKTLSGDSNSNRGKVEDAADVEENVDPQAKKFKNVVQNGATEAISNQAPDSPTVTGTADAPPVTTTVIPPYRAAAALASPVSSTVPDVVRPAIDSASIPTDQIVSHPVYVATYQNNLATGVPPLLAAKQASEAAKSAITLGSLITKTTLVPHPGVSGFKGVVK
jgi:hypothetical protein